MNTGPRQRFGAALSEGVTFLAHDRVLVGLVGFSAIYNPFGQWIEVLFTVDAVRRLGFTGGQVGLVFALGAVGALAGAAAAPLVSRRVGALPAVLVCASVESAVFLVLPLCSPTMGITVLLPLLAVVFAVKWSGHRFILGHPSDRPSASCSRWSTRSSQRGIPSDFLWLNHLRGGGSWPVRPAHRRPRRPNRRMHRRPVNDCLDVRLELHPAPARYPD